MRRRGLTLLAVAVAGLLLLAPGAAAASGFAGRHPARLQLVLPLRAQLAALERFSAGVSDPRSPDYAHFRSISWLAAHFGAPPSHSLRVVEFLRAHGATGVHVDATGLFVDAKMAAAPAERLFSPPVARFRPDAGVARAGLARAGLARAGLARAGLARAGLARAGGPAGRTAVVPVPLRHLVTGVVGLDTAPVATKPHLVHSAPSGGGAPLSGVPAPVPGISGYEPVSGTPAGCKAGVAAGGFSPGQYLTAYDYDQLHAIKADGQGERVALIEIDGFRHSDIATFAQCFGLHVPHIVPFGVGVSKPLTPGGEATLDLEVLDAAAPDLSSIDVYESNPQASDVLMALTAPLQNTGFKPQVISASLGLCESQTVAAVGKAGIASTEAALQMASDSGISFLAASGDDGSADCVPSNATGVLPAPQLAVNYPASSPWVTGVGGTNLTLTPDNTILSQVVWNDGSALEQNGGGIGAGGGGFSSIFSRPSYQSAVVTQRHRAVPDLALLADVSPGYDVYCSAPDCVTASQPNPWQTVGGTSAATPLAAGGLSLIDELLRFNARQDLGLVNPLLYSIGANPTQAAQVFDPVTTGSNDVGSIIDASGGPLGCCTAGPGFNEAAGWGGVNVQALAQVALTTQPSIAGVSLQVPSPQQPVAAGQLLATVGCTGACLASAYAQITIAGSAPFTDHANVYHLSHAGRKTIAITPSRGQMIRLRAAVASGTAVTAMVTGAIVDAGGNVERSTSAVSLRIRS